MELQAAEKLTPPTGLPGLADARGTTLFLPEAPFLRSIWVTPGCDRSWATSVELEAEPPSNATVTDELLDAMEAEVVPADLAQVTYTSGSSADCAPPMAASGAPASSRSCRSRITARRR